MRATGACSKAEAGFTSVAQCLQKQPQKLQMMGDNGPDTENGRRHALE